MAPVETAIAVRFRTWIGKEEGGGEEEEEGGGLEGGLEGLEGRRRVREGRGG